MADAHMQRPITPREAERRELIVAALRGDGVHGSGWTAWGERAELALLGVEAWIEALDMALSGQKGGE